MSRLFPFKLEMWPLTQTMMQCARWTAAVESVTLPLHILVDHGEFKAGMGVGGSGGTAIGAGAGIPHSSHSLVTSRGGAGWRKKK